MLLAPHQCARIRSLARATRLTQRVRLPAKPGRANRQKRSAARKDPMQRVESAWIETPNASVDTTHPYLVRLKEGRSIAVFFDNGPRTRAIALKAAEARRRIAQGGSADSKAGGGRSVGPRRQDGKSSGHHHRYGEMALLGAALAAGPHAPIHGRRAPHQLWRVSREEPSAFEAQIVEDTHGAVLTASSAGAPTAAVRVAVLAGTRDGERRCATRSIACATPSLRCSTRRRFASSKIPTPPATTT